MIHLSNLNDNLPEILARHVNDYKPSGFEFLFIDQHNQHKGHNVIVDNDGDVWYSQAIKHDTGWQNFYEWEVVREDDFHGYRKHLELALELTNKHMQQLRNVGRNKQSLVLDEDFSIHCNQGMRPAIVVEVIGKQALIVYRMPRGKYFIRVIEHDPSLADRKSGTLYLDGIEHSCVAGRRYRDMRGFPRSKITNMWCKGEACERIDQIVADDSLNDGNDQAIGRGLRSGKRKPQVIELGER